jgi:hypothetical protein
MIFAASLVRALFLFLIVTVIWVSPYNSEWLERGEGPVKEMIEKVKTCGLVLAQ